MDKRAILQDLFGATAIDVQSDAAVVDGTRYPIVDDVVILSSPGRGSQGTTSPAEREYVASSVQS